LLDGGFDLLGDSAEVGLKVLQQHLALPQKLRHSLDKHQIPQSSSEPQAVKTMQNPRDFFDVPLYKTQHGAAPVGKG
jgi:hypothetical protein